MTATRVPIYELWDTETGNLITDFADEQAAILAVRVGVNGDGLVPWRAVALVRAQPDGDRTTIDRGDTLIARAFAGSIDPESVQAILRST